MCTEFYWSRLAIVLVMFSAALILGHILARNIFTRYEWPYRLYLEVIVPALQKSKGLYHFFRVITAPITVLLVLLISTNFVGSLMWPTYQNWFLDLVGYVVMVTTAVKVLLLLPMIYFPVLRTAPTRLVVVIIWLINTHFLGWLIATTVVSLFLLDILSFVILLPRHLGFAVVYSLFYIMPIGMILGSISRITHPFNNAGGAPNPLAAGARAFGFLPMPGGGTTGGGTI